MYSIRWGPAFGNGPAKPRPAPGRYAKRPLGPRLVGQFFKIQFVRDEVRNGCLNRNSDSDRLPNVVKPYLSVNRHTLVTELAE